MGLFTVKCPQCRARVKKAANYCSRCGATSPRGLNKCSCGAAVGTRSSYCWNCGRTLKESLMPTIKGNRWLKRRDELAVRIEPKNLKGLLTKGLGLEKGTRAFLLQKGRYLATLEAGSHELGGFLHSRKDFNLLTPTVAVLVESGEVLLHLSIPEAEGPTTSDGVKVGVDCSLFIAIEEPETFLQHLFKDRARLGMEDLEALMTSELMATLQPLLRRLSFDELYAPQTREAVLEREVERSFGQALQTRGMVLLQFHSLEFPSQAYQRLLKAKTNQLIMNKELEVENYSQELIRKRKEVMMRAEMGDAQLKRELEDFLAQMEHEMHLRKAQRENELEELRMNLRLKQRELEALEGEKTQALLQQEQLNRQLTEAQHQIELARLKGQKNDIERQQDVKDSDLGLANLERIKKMKRAQQSPGQDEPAQG